MGRAYFRDEKYLKKFGANLKRVRRETGVSQEDLANELGFSQPYLAKLEAGLVNCSISHVVAIARKLKVPIISLVEI